MNRKSFSSICPSHAGFPLKMQIVQAEIPHSRTQHAKTLTLLEHKKQVRDFAEL
jgi:hypothetical protein